MQILNMQQGSDEWHKARLGIPTASRFKEIITPAKAEPSKSAEAYLYELVAERLTGEPTEHHTTEWMARGNLLEADARKAYEFIHDTTVDEVGFVLNDDETIGVSPDGLIGDSGGLEIKCPKPSTLVRYMVEDKLPDQYKPQVQGCLWVTGREWWDFVAYHPNMELFTVRVYRDEAYIEKMAAHITVFVEKLGETYKKLSHDTKIKGIFL
ncbi:MAG: YqaJ viral recombinase family protein [Sulfurovum sp.]|nr:YqaJ viral recombinase family protein [Sulfurovum sp.]